MIDLPNNICVCPDCMQKSFDAMNNMNFGGMDYSQFMNMGPMMGFGDMDAQIPKSQRVKKKKTEEEKDAANKLTDYKNFRVADLPEGQAEPSAEEEMNILR